MIGIIGGTGLYKIDGLTEVARERVETPFGEPSAEVLIGELGGQKLAFLPRHGSQHQLLPSEINFRANIWALKAVGARRLISVSAVGSLRQEIRPGDLAMPTQYFDWTKGIRERTFFGKGMVGHASTANPACPALISKIARIADENEIKIHTGKIYGCIEGPRLGTQAESHFLRMANCDLVGMTNVPEVFLAREAQLCYTTIAIATDYDCWLDDPNQHASVDKVMDLYKKNIDRVQFLLKKLISDHGAFAPCTCRTSIQHAILSQESTLSPGSKRILAFLRE